MNNQSNQIEQRKVVLVPHQPEWSKLADREAALIRSAFPEIISAIYHIGSTAVPGIKAKPILDFVVVAHDIHQLEEEEQTFQKLGYTAKGERGIPGRRFYSKDTDGIRSHHLHAFQEGHSEIKRHLIFRDYLRTHPEAALKYEQLKERLAKRFPRQSGSYTEAKSEFIMSLDEPARRWYEQRHSSPDQV